MHKLTITGIATLVAAAAFASTAGAEITKPGPGFLGPPVPAPTAPTPTSTTPSPIKLVPPWKLKAKNDDGRIETEFEVDQNRVGKRWRVTIFRNGSKVFSGIRTTHAPSGSFSVGRLLAGTVGPDRIVAKARALSSGETCSGALSI